VRASMTADKARRDRYCSESRHPLHRNTCPLWAIFDQVHRSKV